MKILVTGAAGFIGFHLSKRLVNDGHEVIGLDSINDYYDVNLKFGRLSAAGIEREKIEYGRLVQSIAHSNYAFVQLQLEEREAVMQLFAQHSFDAVVNLAAQAGVRYSVTNPHAYVDANVVGFMNLLEGCRHHHVGHLVYASTSSVYGLNEKSPFSPKEAADHPISLYAATKKANEMMAHVYSHLYGLPTTGLRFFTVYGPWGRPDMALFLFTKAILENRPIDVFNYGKMQRDFTYVDDIVEGIVRVIQQPAKSNEHWDPQHPESDSSSAPYRIYNIGNSAPVSLMEYIEAIESKLGRTAEKNLLPLQPGDVTSTYADTTSLEQDFGYKPETTVREGVSRFIDWYLSFFQPQSS
ncbi:MAG TPA: NAD-dependent epimerase [Phnomibacter sp.]|nr:NAD-dependent epimerase [Phnomibacter sp.]